MAYGLKASSCNPLRQEYYVVIGIFEILTCYLQAYRFSGIALENVPELQVCVKGECSFCLNETLDFSNNWKWQREVDGMYTWKQKVTVNTYKGSFHVKGV